MTTINSIINEVRKGGHVISIKLMDASRYSKSSSGEMVWATTLVEKAYVNRREGDEVIQLGNKQVNLSELERILTTMAGKGEIYVRVGNKVFTDEIVL